MHSINEMYADCQSASIRIGGCAVSKKVLLEGEAGHPCAPMTVPPATPSIPPAAGDQDQPLLKETKRCGKQLQTLWAACPRDRPLCPQNFLLGELRYELSPKPP